MPPDLKPLFEMARERNQAQAAWYRQILTLAAGGLALLVGMSPEVPPDGPARWFLAGAWVCLAAGIVSAAGATYGEVSRAARLTAQLQCQLRQDLDADSAPPARLPLIASPARIYLLCGPAMVGSLLTAVVCLVCFAVLRTLG